MYLFWLACKYLQTICLKCSLILILLFAKWSHANKCNCKGFTSETMPKKALVKDVKKALVNTLILQAWQQTNLMVNDSTYLVVCVCTKSKHLQIICNEFSLLANDLQNNFGRRDTWKCNNLQKVSILLAANKNYSSLYNIQKDYIDELLTIQLLKGLYNCIC